MNGPTAGGVCRDKLGNPLDEQPSESEVDLHPHGSSTMPKS